MKPIIQKVSFFPFCNRPSSQDGYYSIERYDITEHRWKTMGNRSGNKTEIEEYVHDLNKESGMVTEEYIVGYEE